MSAAVQEYSAAEQKGMKASAAKLAKTLAKKASKTKGAKAAPNGDGGARKPAGKLATKKADAKPAKASKPAEPRAPGLKALLHEFFTSGKKGTAEQIAAKFPGRKANTITTTIADLKNPKYALNGKAIKIEKDEKGVFSLKGK